MGRPSASATPNNILPPPPLLLSLLRVASRSRGRHCLLCECRETCTGIRAQGDTRHLPSQAWFACYYSIPLVLYMKLVVFSLRSRLQKGGSIPHPSSYTIAVPLALDASNFAQLLFDSGISSDGLCDCRKDAVACQHQNDHKDPAAGPA